MDSSGSKKGGLFDTLFLKKQFEEWKSFVLSRNFIFCLLPLFLSLILVSIVFPLTHTNGVLHDDLSLAATEGVITVYDLIMKSNHEVLAIILMSLTSICFLRVVISLNSESK